jgi:hypothetical protein
VENSLTTKTKVTGALLLEGAQINNAILTERGGEALSNDLGVEISDVMLQAHAYSASHDNVAVAYGTAVLATIRAMRLAEIS